MKAMDARSHTSFNYQFITPSLSHINFNLSIHTYKNCEKMLSIKIRDANDHHREKYMWTFYLPFVDFYYFSFCMYCLFTVSSYYLLFVGHHLQVYFNVSLLLLENCAVHGRAQENYP